MSMYTTEYFNKYLHEYEDEDEDEDEPIYRYGYGHGHKHNDERDHEYTFNHETIELTLNKYFHKVIILPPNVRKITFGNSFNKFIISNRVLEELKFGNEFNRCLELNINMRKLTFGHEFVQDLLLNAKMEVLVFGLNFNKPIKLNRRLKSLLLDYEFNHDLFSSKKLLALSLYSENFTAHIELPKYLKILTLRLDIFKKTTLNNRLGVLNITYNPFDIPLLTLEKSQNASEKIDVQIYSFAKNKFDTKNFNTRSIYSDRAVGYIIEQIKPINIYENIPNSMERIVINSYQYWKIDDLPNNIKNIVFVSEQPDFVTKKKNDDQNNEFEEL